MYEIGDKVIVKGLEGQIIWDDENGYLVEFENHYEPKYYDERELQPKNFHSIIK